MLITLLYWRTGWSVCTIKHNLPRTESKKQSLPPLVTLEPRWSRNIIHWATSFELDSVDMARVWPRTTTSTTTQPASASLRYFYTAASADVLTCWAGRGAGMNGGEGDQCNVKQFSRMASSHLQTSPTAIQTANIQICNTHFHSKIHFFITGS